MSDANFYERYYQGKLTKINPFDTPPELNSMAGAWSENTKFFRFITNSGIKLDKKSKVLDLGCGPGHALGFLQEKGITKLYGCDISQTAIAQAKENYKNIAFQVITPNQALPYPDNSFDMVYCSEVLEHVIDTETMVREIKRVLKPGGHVLITTTEMYLVKMILVGLFRLDAYFHPMTPHIRHFTRNNLRKFLEDCGLKYKAYGMNGAYLKVLPWGQMVLAEKQQ